MHKLDYPSSSARKVSLEFLRAGPAHNHLLSPLTPYLAVCGNHRASLVHVPWEHAELERQMKKLRYDHGNQSLEYPRDRLATLEEIGDQVAQLLAAAPGVAGGLTTAHSRRASNEELAQLEIVVSANELAWIPFEFAKVPSGAPGGDNQWLLLQTHAPTALTRRIRGVDSHNMRWPLRPRILFAWAAPEMSIVPAQQHLNALLEIIKPWLGVRAPDQSALHWLSPYLTMLPNASLHDIHEACQATSYTHIHVLAHGLRDERTPDRHFCLALHAWGGSTERELVDGPRLAAALQGTHSHGPVVVTVASCDSGQAGDVVEGGASLVHQIHAAGVPFVVGSQFPLSFAGSVIATSKLYTAFVQGNDPRDAVWQARHALHAFFSNDNHDWASLVAYGSLPEDLSARLPELRYQATKGKLDALLNHCDALAQIKDHVHEGEIDRLLQKLVEVMDELPQKGPLFAQAQALQGATKKRLAQREFLLTQPSGYAPTPGESTLDVSIFCSVDRPADETRSKLASTHASRQRNALMWLHQALGHYSQAAQRSLARDGSDDPRRPIPLHWPMTQQLCLAAALGRPLSLGSWESAVLSVELELDHGSLQQDLEAHGSAIELYLLRLAYGQQCTHSLTLEQTRKCLQEHTNQMLAATKGEFIHFTLYLQLKRYVQWWSRPAWHSLLAKGLIQTYSNADNPVTSSLWSSDSAQEVGQSAQAIMDALQARSLVDPSGNWTMR